MTHLEYAGRAIRLPWWKSWNNDVAAAGALFVTFGFFLGFMLGFTCGADSAQTQAIKPAEGAAVASWFGTPKVASPIDPVPIPKWRAVHTMTNSTVPSEGVIFFGLDGRAYIGIKQFGDSPRLEWMEIKP